MDFTKIYMTLDCVLNVGEWRVEWFISLFTLRKGGCGRVHVTSKIDKVQLILGHKLMGDWGTDS